MKKITYLWLILLAGLFEQAHAQDHIISLDQIHSDLAVFRTALEKVHPEMYRYTTPQTFDSLFAVVKSQFSQAMSQQEFYKAMLPLLVALRDGHIKWIVAGRDQHYPFHTDQLFPLKLYFVGKKAWIAGDYREKNFPEGAEIISINKRPIAAILEDLMPNLFFADGYTTNGNFHELNHFFSGYYATHFGGFDRFEVIYREGNEEKVLLLEAVSEKTIKDYVDKYSPKEEKLHRFSILDDTTALMTIEAFWGKKKEYLNFLKETFMQLKEQKIKNLIIDIRNNEGGSESFGMLLYSYLAKSPFLYYDHISINPEKDLPFPASRPKHYKIMRKLLVRKNEGDYLLTKMPGLKPIKPKDDAFDGEVYVLINGSSFSVTTEFSARVHSHRRATFIGQETSGGYQGNNSGIFTIVQLPNSKIDLGIPMLGFHMADLPTDLKLGQGIIPDYQLTPTIEDVLSKRDPELEFTLRLIREGS